MRLGNSDQWVELGIAGYEGSVELEDDDEVYDLETEWMVLRADLADGNRRRSYGAISLAMDECVVLTRWLAEVAANPAGPSGPAEDGALIAFIEPDLAAWIVQRVGDSVTIRWIVQDERSQEMSPPEFMAYRAVTFDIAASTLDIEGLARELTETLRLLISQRSAEIRALGGVAGPDPFSAGRDSRR